MWNCICVRIGYTMALVSNILLPSSVHLRPPTRFPSSSCPHDLTILQIRSPESRLSPALTLKPATLPECGAERTISIFIADMMATGSAG